MKEKKDTKPAKSEKKEFFLFKGQTFYSREQFKKYIEQTQQ